MKNWKSEDIKKKSGSNYIHLSRKHTKKMSWGWATITGVLRRTAHLMHSNLF